MALATRPKPKVQHKKRRAQHHRQSKHYLKTYLPYLPMLAILGVGYGANRWLANIESASTSLNPNLDPSTSLTRIEIMAGDHGSTALAITISLAVLAMAIFLATHWFRIRQAINRGEAYAVRHPWLDITLVFVITSGVVLTRSTGIF